MKKKRTKSATAATREPQVTDTNREAIRLINEWAARPPLHNAAFWRDFEQELKANRFQVRRAK